MGKRSTEPEVLVIEEDDEVRESLADMLTVRGYAALGVATTDRGRALLEIGFRPRAIVLDPFTPNGAAAFQCALAANPKWSRIPLILGAAAPETRDEHRVGTLQRRLKRPLDVRQLLDFVGQYCAPTSVRR